MANASDNFNRANEPLTAGPWTLVDFSGVSTANIVGNQVVFSSTNRSGARHNTPMDTNDHRAEVQLLDYDGGVFCRGDSNIPATCYFCTSWAGETEFFKSIAGVTTFINSCDPVPLGQKLFLEVEGDQITFGRVGGVGTQIRTITDTSIVSGTRVGIAGSGNEGTLDDWSSIDLGGGGMDPILVGTGSLADRIMAGLISQGFTTGSISDRERARLLAKLVLPSTTQLSLHDLYKLASEPYRLLGIYGGSLP